MTIDCKYTCGDCHLYRVSVTVKARAGESVTDWMDKTAVPTLMADHARRSPNCHPREFKELLIPIPPGTDKIGGVVVQ